MEKPEQTKKLIQRLLDIVAILRHTKDAMIRQQLDEFLYLEKIEELKLLLEQLQLLTRKIDDLSKTLNECYGTAYCQWRKDVMWLRRYNHQKYPRKNSVL